MIPVPPAVVGHVVDRVFRRSMYQRSFSHSLWEEFASWFLRFVDRLARIINGSPAALLVIRWTAYVLAAVVAGVILRAIVRYYWDQRGEAHVRFSADAVTDLFGAADGYAHRGDYTMAAHTLYAGLIRLLAQSGRVRAHSSKTTGDYTRELRRANVGPLAAAFAAFAGVYEVVIYRDGTCDADRYARLRTLAEPVIRVPHRAAA